MPLTLLLLIILIYPNPLRYTSFKNKYNQIVKIHAIVIGMGTRAILMQIPI